MGMAAIWTVYKELIWTDNKDYYNNLFRTKWKNNHFQLSISNHWAQFRNVSPMKKQEISMADMLVRRQWLVKNDTKDFDTVFKVGTNDYLMTDIT